MNSARRVATHSASTIRPRPLRATPFACDTLSQRASDFGVPPVLRSTPPPPSCAPTILRLRLLRAQAVSAQPLLFSPSTAPASSSSPRCRHPSQFIMCAREDGSAPSPHSCRASVPSRLKVRSCHGLPTHHTTHCRGWPLVPPYPATLSLLHRPRHLYFISFLHLLPPPPPLGSSAGQKQLPLQGERGRRPEREQKPPPRGSGNACAESDRG